MNLTTIPIEVGVTDEALAWARSLTAGGFFPYDNLGSNKDPLHYGVTGFVAEWASQTILPGAKHFKTGDFDFIFEGLKYDVKALSYARKPWAELYHPIRDKQKKCDVDRYIFASVTPDYRTVYLMGWLEKIEFWKSARKFKKGDTMYDNGRGSVRKATTDCHAVTYGQLKGFA